MKIKYQSTLHADGHYPPIDMSCTMQMLLDDADTYMYKNK